MAAASPYKVGQSFSENAVVALDRVGFNRFAIGISVDLSSNRREYFLAVFALDFLAVAQTVFVKVRGKHRSVVVVAVAVEFEFVFDNWLLDDGY